MSISIGEVFNNLALKAGIRPDDESLKVLLASPELINIKVTDELVSAIDKGLLNIEAAKNNHPDIKKKYFADAYDGVDKFLLGLVDDETFTPEDAAEIKSERSTTKKIELMTAKLKSAKTKADPADKAAINQQIKDLHEAARLAKEDKLNTVKDYEGRIKDIQLQSALNGILGGYKTIYDELPGDVKVVSLKAILNKALQDNDAVLDVNENGALNLIRKDGSNVFGSDHRQYTPQSFLDKTLAPILKVSTKAQQPTGVTPLTAVPGQVPAANSVLKSLAESSLADMANAEKVSMM